MEKYSRHSNAGNQGAVNTTLGLHCSTQAQHPTCGDSVPAQPPNPFLFIIIIGGNPHFLPRTNIFPNRHRTLCYELEKSICTDMSLVITVHLFIYRSPFPTFHLCLLLCILLGCRSLEHCSPSCQCSALPGAQWGQWQGCSPSDGFAMPWISAENSQPEPVSFPELPKLQDMECLIFGEIQSFDL